MERPIASLSCDLDDRWAYMKTHGNPAWEQLPSYLTTVVPRYLSVLNRHRVRSTMFLVGQDAALERNQGLLRTIADAGHEIGNHSFHHDPWLDQYSEQEIATEIALAEVHIERATGHRPVGFRGPGYSLSEAMIAELIRRGYLYDASTFPTFIGPLARAYFLMSSRFTKEELEKRKGMFGTVGAGFKRIHPYKWHVNGKSLVEIPVTTMPFFRVPIHVSYVLYLSLCSRTLAERYFRFALFLCRASGVQPSILFHPLDFLGPDEAEGVAFFPGMKLPLETKLELIDSLLERIQQTFRIVTLREHAIKATQQAVMPAIEPAF